MIKARWKRYVLDFTFEARTSRSSMWHKPTYFIQLYDDATGFRGVGECNLFPGLSADDVPNYEDVLIRVCEDGCANLPPYSSILFGFQTAMMDMANSGKGKIFDSAFTRGLSPISINGLIWMGPIDLMAQRIKEKLEEGYRCIKLKIGALSLDDELSLIAGLRRRFSEADLELRLDANGAFVPHEALGILERLAPYGIHSIEQPIAPGQLRHMRSLCQCSPIPIALDEELIGCSWQGANPHPCIPTDEQKEELLSYLRPHYIIIKPALCGGFDHAARWIDIASDLGIGWWATSALESNIGLSAIAQWVSTFDPLMPQGLGTGHLYSNNVPSPITCSHAQVRYDPQFIPDYSAFFDSI